MEQHEINKVNQELSTVKWENNFNLSFDYINDSNQLLSDEIPLFYIKESSQKYTCKDNTKKKNLSKFLSHFFISIFLK